MLWYLVSVDPVNVRAQVNGGALVEGTHLGDRLSQQLGQGDPHLLLHQGQPFIDLGVLSDGHWGFEDNLESRSGRNQSASRTRWLYVCEPIIHPL